MPNLAHRHVKLKSTVFDENNQEGTDYGGHGLEDRLGERTEQLSTAKKPATAAKAAVNEYASNTCIWLR